MVATLRAIMEEKSNDYRAYETLYEQVTGQSLVGGLVDPRPSRADTPITLTVSVVINCFNSADTIQRCLGAIEESSFNHKYPELLEVIVVDDGSTDGTWEILQRLKLALHLQCVRQERRQSKFAANTGISVSSGQVVVVCDSDILLTTFAIEEFARRHQILSDVLLIGFRYETANSGVRGAPGTPDVHQIGVAAAAPDFFRDKRISFDLPGWPENMCGHFDHLKNLGHSKQIWMTDNGTLSPGHWDTPRSTWSLHRLVYGALFSLRRSHFLELDGFSEEMVGWGWDDAMLGAKAIGAGLYIVPVYSAVGRHVSHVDRSPNKWIEADKNYERLQAALDRPPSWEGGTTLRRAVDRIAATATSSHRRSSRPLPDQAHRPIRCISRHPFKRGQYNFYTDRLGDALTDFECASEFDASAMVALWHAKTLERLGNPTESRRRLRDAIRQWPNDAGLRLEGVKNACLLGRYREARGHLDTLASVAPSAPALRFLFSPIEEFVARGKKFRHQGDLDIAARDLGIVMARDPSNMDARNELRNLHGRLGR